MNFRVHRLTANFGTAEISLLFGTTAIRGAVEQRTSVYTVQRRDLCTTQISLLFGTTAIRGGIDRRKNETLTENSFDTAVCCRYPWDACCRRRYCNRAKVT